MTTKPIFGGVFLCTKLTTIYCDILENERIVESHNEIKSELIYYFNAHSGASYINITAMCLKKKFYQLAIVRANRSYFSYSNWTNLPFDVTDLKFLKKHFL